jgi:hypothetical protein
VKRVREKTKTNMYAKRDRGRESLKERERDIERGRERERESYK